MCSSWGFCHWGSSRCPVPTPDSGACTQWVWSMLKALSPRQGRGTAHDRTLLSERFPRAVRCERTEGRAARAPGRNRGWGCAGDVGVRSSHSSLYQLTPVSRRPQQEPLGGPSPTVTADKIKLLVNI